MQNENWCKSLLGKFDQRLWEMNARSDQFESHTRDLTTMWNDSGSRKFVKRRLQPFRGNYEKLAKRLSEQQTGLNEAVTQLTESFPLEASIHQNAERSREISKQIEHLIDRAYSEVEHSKTCIARTREFDRNASKALKEAGLP